MGGFQVGETVLHRGGEGRGVVVEELDSPPGYIIEFSDGVEEWGKDDAEREFEVER